MSRSHITEEDERDSLSLDQHTLIQVYDNLDSSDGEQGDSSSNDHSLSRSQHHQLMNLHQQRQYQQVQPEQQPQRQRGNPSTRGQGRKRHFSDLESKYDLGISPSTKEEYSIMRANQQAILRGHHIKIKESPQIDKSESEMGRQYRLSSSQKPNSQEDNDSCSVQSGRQARLGVMRKEKPQFNIDSFLNAEPVHNNPNKEKKGIQVLGLHKGKKGIQSKPKVTYFNDIIKEEDSISLITLPQVEAVRAEKVSKALLKGQKELQQLNSSYEHRFKQARLAFIDNFLPESLKIKSNPYNLFKYIQNRVRI